MTNLSWERLPNGDRQAKEHPIRLIKPFSRRSGDAGWLVKVPVERDPNFADGWHWTAVVNPTYTQNRGGSYLDGDDYNEARALVAEHLEFILSQVPADYGQPEPEPVPVETPVAPEPVTAAPAAPPPPPSSYCACGCGEEVSNVRVYRAGHDARHRDKLIDLLVRSNAPAVRARRIEALIVGLGGRD